MLTMVNVGCLWSWVWMQFVVLNWYGIPWLPSDVESVLTFYQPGKQGPLSIPELFMLGSIMGVAILTPAAVGFTRNAKGRWRMLFVLAFFSTLTLGFGWKVLGWRAGYLENAAYEVSFLKEHIHADMDPRYREEILERISRLETLIHQARSEQR